ncbi:SIR2-like domain-containing protein [Bacteroidales bacterium WCE2004]|nr:SIR2-like domain-containing protein [Bacteroidales bacterium WCE2004]
MNKYREIIELVRKEDVALFVGAGCSISSGAPTGIQLAQIIWEKLEPDFKDENAHSSLQKVSEALILQNGNNRDTLNKVIFDNLAGLEPSSFHKLLRKIPHFRTIITTNFDSLIETAYSFSYFQTIVNDQELVALKENDIHLFKIHGDVSHLDQIIVSESDYRKFLQSPRNTLLWSKVISEFSSKHVVFVGYSADDQNILGLIDLIQKQLEGKAKKMFLISPSLSKTQEARLKTLRINHINGTGEEFLSFTFSALKDSFGDDKYENICSQDTLTRFALLCGVQFSFENNGKHTSITRWRSSNGSPCPLEMNITTKSLDIIKGKTPTTVTEIVKGFGIPMYALSQDEMASFKLRINELRINGTNEITRVLVGPAINDINIAFISREQCLNCRCKAKKYSKNGECHILIPTPIYNLELTISFSNITNNVITCSLTIKLNEGQFEDLEAAIRWTKLLACMQDGVTFTLHLGPIVLKNTSFSPNGEGAPIYKEWMEYCMNLHDIEEASNTLLPYYEGFTPNSFLFSKIIRSYLKHEAFSDKPREAYQTFTVDIDKGSFQADSHGDYLARVITQINGPFSLCGVEYSIAEERVLLQHCKIELVEAIDKKKERLHFTNQNETVQYEYCDKEEPDRIIQKQ